MGNNRPYNKTYRQTISIAVLLIAVACLCYCNAPEAPVKTENPDSSVVALPVTPAFLNVDETWADSVLNTMTLDEKIGQLIMIRAYSNQGSRHQKNVEEQIRRHGIGGIIFFQGGPGRQVNLTNHYQSISKIPLFIAMDGEWGLGMRLDSTLHYPYQMTLGAIQDDQLIKSMASDIGQQFKRLGVHWNLAPVVDINNNANNPVINYRSFGEDKHNVTLKSHQYMVGLEEKHILTSIKHFPGHGDTSTDSHKALPVITHNLERLKDIELYPFKALIERGVQALMVGHLSVPALDSTLRYPTSLSKTVITKILKEEMGFKGLVISDAMDMRGLTDYVEKDSAEVLALQAGNDIIELVQDVGFAIHAIRGAVESNKIGVSEIDEKCRKILLAKYWTGLSNRTSISSVNLHQHLNNKRYDSLITELHRRSITLLENKDSILHKIPSNEQSVAVVSVGNGQLSKFAKKAANSLGVKPLTLPRYASAAHVGILKKQIEKFDHVLLSLHQIYKQPRVKPGYGKNTLAFIENLLVNNSVLLVSFRNPYVLSQIENIESAKAVILTYQENKATQNILAELFSGNISISGRLPVTINDVWRVGHGINLEK